MGNSTSSIPWDLKCKICREFIESPFRNFNWTTNEKTKHTEPRIFAIFVFFFGFEYILWMSNCELACASNTPTIYFVRVLIAHLCANCTATSLNCDFILNLLLLLLLFLPSLNCIFTVIPLAYLHFVCRWLINSQNSQIYKEVLFFFFFEC